MAAKSSVLGFISLVVGSTMPAPDRFRRGRNVFLGSMLAAEAHNLPVSVANHAECSSAATLPTRIRA
jgi:hypothetical protein